VLTRSHVRSLRACSLALAACALLLLPGCEGPRYPWAPPKKAVLFAVVVAACVVVVVTDRRRRR
jgi:hypothetical protein